MKYTKYFLEQYNSHHTPSEMSKANIQRILKIVSLESKLSGIMSSSSSSNGAYLIRKELNDLTKRRPPIDLWNELINKSL